MAVEISQTANPAGVATSSNVATYTDASIGAEAQDRIVVVLVGCEDTDTIDSCTIGGNAATAGSLAQFSTTIRARIFWLHVPTGTTATVAVTFSGTVADTANHIAVYRVVGASLNIFNQGTDTSTDMDATDPLTTGSITIPTGGGFIAVAAGATDTTGKTWTTGEDLDVDAGAFRFCTAFSITPATTTITCTGGTNGEDGALAWMIFASSFKPHQMMAIF